MNIRINAVAGALAMLATLTVWCATAVAYPLPCQNCINQYNQCIADDFYPIAVCHREYLICLRSSSCPGPIGD
jgi:hypothetical protein